MKTKVLFFFLTTTPLPKSGVSVTHPRKGSLAHSQPRCLRGARTHTVKILFFGRTVGRISSSLSPVFVSIQYDEESSVAPRQFSLDTNHSFVLPNRLIRNPGNRSRREVSLPNLLIRNPGNRKFPGSFPSVWSFTVVLSFLLYLHKTEQTSIPTNQRNDTALSGTRQQVVEESKLPEGNILTK